MRRSCFLAPLLTLLAAAAVSACATTHEEFKPTERVQGYTIEGFKEAFYDLSSAGVSGSEVKVWSSGADWVQTAQGKVTRVQVGFTVDNGSREPIEVVRDHLRLESVQARTAIHADIAPESVTGDATVRPSSTGTFVATFLLPRGTSPGQVKAFRVKWSVRSEAKEYTEFTPFVVQKPEYAYVPVYGYYYPYWPWSYPFYDPFFIGRVSIHPRIVMVAPYPRRVVVEGYRR